MNIVISGINLFEGGALSVYKDCLDNILNMRLYETNRIVAFVYKKELFEDYQDYIEFIEIPNSRKSYLLRFYYEYLYFYRYSKNKEIDVWFSLHDMTPNVVAKYRYVYCHNPSPFIKQDLNIHRYGIKNYLYFKFYKYVYRINIQKNKAVIVQQNWIKKEFEKMFNIKNVVVAKPKIKNNMIRKYDTLYNLYNLYGINNKNFIFIYPAYPRFFKNFEVICEAVRYLDKDIREKIQVILTIDGTENKYSREIVKKYSNIKEIKFIGIQKRDDIFKLYNISNCMIFPSRLETWGMPITEFISINKPILISDLPYAYETVGDYSKVKFFNPNDFKKLAYLIKEQLKNKIDYDKLELSTIIDNNEIIGWDKLINFILDCD